MPQLIQSTLKKRFGFDTFRPGQRKGISYALDGQDTLVVMPTGSGISLCYQLPALLFEGITTSTDMRQIPKSGTNL